MRYQTNIAKKMQRLIMLIVLATSITCQKERYDDNASLLSIDLTVAVDQENVDFELAVDNSTNSNIVVTYASSQRYDFAVYDSVLQMVWQWSIGMSFLPSEEQDTIWAENMMIFEETWDKTNNIDTTQSPIPGGDYTVKAVYLGNGNEKEVKFTIQ
jgi:uncharacterized protein YxeA